MKTLYIHVGTRKTGTTTLQNFFANNKQSLEQKGIYYPMEGSYYDPFGAGQHLLAFALLGHRPYWLSQKLKYTKKGCIEEIQKHLNATNCNNILLSSEHFFKNDPVEIKSVFENLPLAVKIIVYLRRQDKYLESSYNQLIKMVLENRHFENFVKEEIENENSKSPHYYAKLTKFAEVFGKENIIVRPFEKQQFYHQDLIEDFLHLLGLSCEKGFLIPKAINESIPYELVNLMAFFNKTSNLEQRQQVMFNRLLMQLYPKIKKQHYEAFSPKLRREVIDHFKTENTRIANEFLDRKEGQLFYEPLPDLHGPWKPCPDVSLQQVTELTINVWQQLEIQRSKQKIHPQLGYTNSYEITKVSYKV